MKLANSLRLRPRLLAAIAVAIVVALVLPSAWRLATRAVLGWDAAILVYIAASVSLIRGASLERMRKRAGEEDEGATAILALTAIAALASLAAIAVQLGGIDDQAGEGRTPHLALAGVTILLSWFFVHLIFAIHYAHEFYGGDGGTGHRRGLAFPKEHEPDYLDFLYFSITIGAAAQTSDVAVESRAMRRLVLGHTVLSFLFNTMVLALAVNVGASLISSK